MKNRVFLLSAALVAVLSVALNQQSNPIVSWFSPAMSAEAQAVSRTFAGEGGQAAAFFFIEKGIKPFQDGVAIDDTPLTTQKICELAGYSRVAYLTTRNFKSCGDNFVETWNGSAWVRSGACSAQPYIDTLTCDTPIVQAPVCTDKTHNAVTVTRQRPFITGIFTNPVYTQYTTPAFKDNIGGPLLAANGLVAGSTLKVAASGTMYIYGNDQLPYYPDSAGETALIHKLVGQWTNDQDQVIGDGFGLNANNTLIVPTGATRLYVAFTDDTYFDNHGSFTVQATTSCAPVTPTTVDLKINGQDGTVSIPVGQTATLSWTSTNAARCDTTTSNMPGWGQYEQLPTSGSRQVTITQGGTFGIQCAQTATSNMIAQDSVGVYAVSSSSSSSAGSCRVASFEAANGSLTAQGWTDLDPGANQSATTMTENGVTFLRINDQSTTRGLRTEFTSIPDSALADRDWTLEMKARVHNSTENGYTVGMNMLLTSPGGKYASIYIDTDKFGPIGTSINQYNYARTTNADTTNGFHTYTIRYEKNGGGVNDDTFDVLFDGQEVMSNVGRNEIWDSGVWNQNINGISFGVGSSPGQAQMDVAYVRFRNTDSNNCPTSSSSSSVSTGGWQCSNGIDDDGDGQADGNDPGCHTDKNRFNSMSYNPYGTESDNNRGFTCQDGVDNNTNGLVDSQDPICHSDGNPNNNASFTPNANEGFGGSSSSSSSTPGFAQCNNGYDDDGDALVDSNDPGCHTDRNRYNSASYNPNGTENGNDRNRGCQDGIDNNGNGQIDAQDPICHSDGNPNNPGSFDPNRNEDGGGSQGNGCIIIKTRAEDEDGDRIDDDLPAFTVQLNNGTRSAFTDEDGDARFSNLANGSYNVTMLMFGDWEVDNVSPSNGNVTVSGSSCKTVTFNLIDNDDGNNDDDDDDNDGDDAEVEVRKTAGSSEVFPGGTIEYVITIENTGDVDLENLTVEDRIPSDLTIIDDGDADDRDGNELTWEIDIDEGDVETIRYRVAVPSYMFPGQTIRNDVRVTSDDGDDDIDIDEDASAFITVIGTMPQTGMIGMVSNASAYLTPIRQAAATSSSSGMGTAAAAATTVLTGLGGGFALGRKYLGL